MIVNTEVAQKLAGSRLERFGNGQRCNTDDFGVCSPVLLGAALAFWRGPHEARHET
jgi:hypothetical protein